MSILSKIQSHKVNNGIMKKIIATVKRSFGISINADIASSAGEDSVPIKDDIGVLIEAGGIGNYVLVGVISESQGAKEGEKILYSRDSNSNVMTKIYLTNTGALLIESKDIITITGEKTLDIKTKEDINIKSDNKVVINEGNDYAVKFNELDREMNTLKEQLNGFIKEYNLHTHGTPSGASTPPAVPSVTNISLNISSSKSDTLQIP